LTNGRFNARSNPAARNSHFKYIGKAPRKSGGIIWRILFYWWNPGHPRRLTRGDLLEIYQGAFPESSPYIRGRFQFREFRYKIGRFIPVYTGNIVSIGHSRSRIGESPQGRGTSRIY